MSSRTADIPVPSECRDMIRTGARPQTQPARFDGSMAVASPHRKVRQPLVALGVSLTG